MEEWWAGGFDTPLYLAWFVAVLAEICFFVLDWWQCRSLVREKKMGGSDNWTVRLSPYEKALLAQVARPVHNRPPLRIEISPLFSSARRKREGR
jgi:hypothetical protein